MFSMTSLKCFSAAAEELNFTRAAKRLFISQQALSSHISKLEDYYEAKLFDRGPPLTLTDAGRALQRRAQEILSSVDNYSREVQDIKNFRQGELRVGIPVTRGTIMLPPLLSAFHQMFPQITLLLTELTGTADLTKTISGGTADLYICYQPEDTQGLLVTPLFEEMFVLLVPKKLLREYYPGQYWDSNPKRLQSLNCFSALPFVAQDPGTINGYVFQRLCQKAGFQPKIVVSTVNLITELSLCLENVGACVLPSTFLPGWRLSNHSIPLVSKAGLERLAIFPLDTSGLGKFQISICRPKSRALTRAGREFIQLARAIYGENGPGNRGEWMELY